MAGVESIFREWDPSAMTPQEAGDNRNSLYSFLIHSGIKRDPSRQGEAAEVKAMIARLEQRAQES